MIDEDWLSHLDFPAKNGIRIGGLEGVGNEKVVLTAFQPDGTRIVVQTYKHHLGYHIQEVPPFLSAAREYDVARVNRKLLDLMGSGYVDAISPDYDRMFSSVIKWFHTSFCTHQAMNDWSVSRVAMIIRTSSSLVAPMSPEALHFISATEGIERRLQEIASLPPGNDVRLMLPRVNLPNFPIDGTRDELVKWAERMLLVQADLRTDAPFQPETLEHNFLFVWGAAVLDEFFPNEELSQVKHFIEGEVGDIVAQATQTAWFEQIEAVAHLLASFLKRSNVERLVHFCGALGFLFAVHGRNGEVVVPLRVP